MTNIIFSDEYDLLPDILREQRRRAGVSQSALAERMRRSQSHIYKMETRQRRIELVEFCRYVEAAGGDPATVFRDFLTRLEQARPSTSGVQLEAAA